MRRFFIVLVNVFIITNLCAQTKSYKRGVAYGYHSAQDMEEYSKYISWWYNWASQPDAAIRTSYQDYNVDFTPMAWNISGINGVKYWADRDTAVKYILGYNEPNFIEQANIVPSKAAGAWHYLEQIAQEHNLKIVGPAVNYCGNCVSENGVTYTNPFKYLDDFFAACTDCQVDYLGLHWYGSGNSIMNYIDDARKYNKPIWVTEFASWDYSNPVANAEEQIKYLAGTTNFLERDPDIYRYSWFIGRRLGEDYGTAPYIDLYAKENGMLTELGQMYMDIPVYDPEQKFEVPGRIEAEEYYLMSGLFSEPTEDEDGFLNIGWTDVGDWAEYKILVANSGTFQINARIAGSSGAIDFRVDDVFIGRLAVPSTGGLQNWKSVSMEIELEEGDHILKMQIRNAGFNINWIEITYPTAVVPEFNIVDAEVYPNPVTNGIINVNMKGVNAGSDFVCSLYDIHGAEILTQLVKPDRNFFQLNINSEGKIKPGMYYLTVTGESAQANKLLVIQ